MNLLSRIVVLFLFCLFASLVHAGPGETGAVPDPALEALEALEIADDPAEASAETADVDDERLSEKPLLKDVFLVLDNSGSMQKNDPQLLARTAVVEFISRLDYSTRVGIILFDQAVNQTMPLTAVTDTTRNEILTSLDQITYKGQFTDSPAAIERAIYALKENGRPDAKKLIIFMTDGIVDTGDANQDLEKSRWLKNNLAADAAESGIQIFGIAFTEEADFQLIQSLAQQTSGEYYRAVEPEDLQNVFGRVHTIMNQRPKPEPLPEPELESLPVTPPPALPVEMQSPEPVVIEVPVQSQGMGEEERSRSMLILVALGLLIIAVIIMVLMLLRSSRKKIEEVKAQEAFLNDVHGHTEKSRYSLGDKPTMLGRVAGGDNEHLQYIVIPESTVGRRHALIEYKDFSYWVIDQGSINGTFVNDNLITRETRLKHGDKLRFHKFEFEFQIPEMSDADMTQVSNTLLSKAENDIAEDITIARKTHSRMTSTDIHESDLPKPDFDPDANFTVDTSEQETVVHEGFTRDDAPDKFDEDGADETLLLDEGNDVTEAPQDDKSEKK